MMDHLLEASIQRYVERTPIREENRRRLASDGVFGSSEIRTIRRRFQRLGWNAEAIRQCRRDIASGRVHDDLEVERLLGYREWVGIQFLEQAQQVARTVGRIQVPVRPTPRFRKESGHLGGPIKEGGAHAPFRWGTGVLISPRLILTTYSAIPTIADAREAKMDFLYDLDVDGRAVKASTFRLAPEDVFVACPDLGYTIVAVAEYSLDHEDPGMFGFCPLLSDEGCVVLGERLSQVLHPDGERKQLALREFRLNDVFRDFYHYEGRGCSCARGAPLFNDQWELVGLHQSSIPKRDENARFLDRCGRPWRDSESPEQIDWIGGEAVRISRIARHLRIHVLPYNPSPLLEEVFHPRLHQSVVAPNQRWEIPPEDAGVSVTQGQGAAISGRNILTGITDRLGLGNGSQGPPHRTNGPNKLILVLPERNDSSTSSVADADTAEVEQAMPGKPLGTLPSNRAGAARRSSAVEAASSHSQQLAENAETSDRLLVIPMFSKVDSALEGFTPGSNPTISELETAIVPRSHLPAPPALATASASAPAFSDANPNAVGVRDDPELMQALEELDRSESRNYYDRDADLRDRDTYYACLSDELPPDRMFARLHDLLKTTHENPMQVLPFRILYPWIDLHPDRKLHCLYSGKIHLPEEVIRDDFQAGVRRRQRLRELHLRGMDNESSGIANSTTATATATAETACRAEREKYQAELNEISRTLAFQCEEIVPRDWCGGAEPMRSDLHHLFMSNLKCRDFRGNRPFMDVAGRGSCVTSMAGAKTLNGFEPLRSSGVVARAILYFLVRHPGMMASVYHHVIRDTLPLLVKWHEMDPVGIYEKHRNQAIFQLQGNRNPFIDFPDWVKRVDFHQGIESNGSLISADADSLRAG